MSFNADKPKGKGGRPRGSHELANFIRASAKRAIEDSEKDGQSLADLLKKEMQARPLEFIKAVAAYTPKEIDIVDDRDVSELTEKELDERIARLTAAVEAGLERAAKGSEGQGGDSSGEEIPPQLH